MLELKNVSKFYYSKNTVASGFAKVNLKLNDGEFVAITGESGSGKSTLLNVISGLDSYEEGEMYINGEETSGYTEKDFEEYRKKYIGNIFQNFNLVNSYTVYQNVELVLLINGYKKREVKAKILETLEKVDLLKYKNTKVSKLSGGQKQRVAIARALVKETPIIVADEPTGNLDSKTAANIVELLKEVAKDKLIVVVTHNYEQIEKYVTRKITMNDGRIIEDKQIGEKTPKDTKTNKNLELEKWDETNSTRKQGLSNGNKILLAIRNTFNIKIKFLLLLAVYLFVSIAVVSEYSSLKKQEYEESNLGYNNYFNDMSDKRIIIKKNNLSEITKEDYEKINKLDNVDYVIENDYLLDKFLVIMLEQTAFAGQVNSIDNYNHGDVDVGRLPQNDKEVLLYVTKDYYHFLKNPQEVIGKQITIIDPQNNNENMLTNTIEIVGITYQEEDANSLYSLNRTKVYISNNNLEEIRKNINITLGTVETEFNNKILQSPQYRVIPNTNVPEGEAYVPEDLNYMTKKNNCLKYNMNIKLDNLYYKDTMDVKISKTYNKKNIKKLLGIEDFDKYNGSIFVNPNQYASLYDKGNYQSSVYVKDVKEVENVLQDLRDMDYTVLYIKDVLVDPAGEVRVIMNAIKIIMIAVVMVVLFFISYFVIKIIMKSRNIYFSTIRILGATRKNANQLLQIELFAVLNIAYLITLAVLGLVKQNIIKIQYLQSMVTYLKISDLCILYAILTIISLLISTRYAKQLFKKSAMNTYREEE